MIKKEGLIDVNDYKESKFMEKVSLVVLVSIIVSAIFSINGCSNIAVLHSDYCNHYSEDERLAFRTLTGNSFKIDCEGK